MVNSKRINATVNDDTYDKLYKMAKIKNISVSQYIHMSLINQLKSDQLLLDKPEIEQQLNLLTSMMQDLQKKIEG